MSLLKKLLIYLCIFYVSLLGAQDPMQEGYSLLEAEDYPAAQTFFKEYIGVYDKTARICYGRALGLGGAPAQALEFFMVLDADYPHDLEVELNLGEAYLWNKKTTAAQKLYADLLSRAPGNFVANLGYANALAAEQQNDLALKYLDIALALKPGDPSALVSKKYTILAKAYNHYKNGEVTNAKQTLAELLHSHPNDDQALQLMAQLNQAQKTTVVGAYTSSSDQGGNESRNHHMELSFHIAEKHKLRIDADLRNTIADAAKASQQSFIISDYFHINKKLRFNVGAGISSGRSENVVSERVLFRSALEVYFSERLYSKVEYLNEIHNYTVDLIERNILMRHLSLSANMMLTPKLGLYINGVYSLQSDDNSRNLAYGSLYYSLTKDPLVRLGANVNYMTYRKSFKNYFSPEQFLLGELFMLLDNYESTSPLKYHLQASFGLQRIEQGESQAISRVEAKLGYYFNNSLFLNAQFATNSASTATAVGEYLFQEWSVTAGLKF